MNRQWLLSFLVTTLAFETQSGGEDSRRCGGSDAMLSAETDDIMIWF